jgi:cytochrome c551
MTDRRLPLRALAALALVLAALAAGCGGDDGDDGGSATAPQTQAQTGADDDSGGAAAPTADGAQLFEDRCGSCHTLAAADTGGMIGPNLDELRPDRQQVLDAIAEGPSSMPPNLYEGAEAEAVAGYVSENAGR